MLERSPVARAASLLALAALAIGCGAPALAWSKPFPDGAPPSASGSKGDKKDKDAKAGAPGESPFTEWSKVTKDATRKEGFFSAWTKRENIYWEIRQNQLEKPFLLNAHFARGIGLAFQLGGLPIADGLAQFERYGDRIFLVMPNVRITANSADSAYRRAVDLSIGGSVVQSFKIESEKDSTVLIDMAPLFASDILDLSTRFKNSTTKSFRFDKERSSVTSHKVFPKNVEAEALLTFSPSDRENLNLSTVPDPRFVPVSVHYSFLELPTEPYVPRLVDDRVGFFLDAYKDMSRDGKDDFWVRYVNRWKLEKKDPSAAISDVKQPIVFYLDTTIPEEWKPYVKAGIEEWQKAFEAAGLRNAIIAKDVPKNDHDWDAEDARYSTIRWITSSEPSFGAIGPSQTDPRTGQILNADILMEGSMITGYSNTWRRWVGQETVDGIMGLAPADLAKRGLDGSYGCEAGLGHALEGAFLATSLQLDGIVPPGQPVPKEFVGAGLKAVTMHEVGHTLGMRHNFKSSTATPMDRLQDKAWVDEHGLVASIMDYDTPNVATDGMAQGYYWSPTVGTADVWTIRYGYTPTSATTPEDDYKIVSSIAREASLAGHEYGTDEDTYPADALDPRCNIYDLGSDPLAFAKSRVEYVSTLWKDPSLENKLMRDNDSYVALRRAMDTMLLQYTRGLSHARKYVGGQYASRAHKGDPEAQLPFEPVPPAKQKEAMSFLADRCFSPRAFDVPPALLGKIGKDQNFDWGNNLFAYGSQEYPFLARVEQIQTAALNGLLDPALLQRVREQELKSADPLRVADVFSGLTNSIMSEVGVGGAVAKLSALDTPMPRRELQRTYVDKLAEMVATPAPNLPEDAQALARLHLTRISDACQKDLTAVGPKSDTVRAHLLEMRARSKRALDAQRNLPAPVRPAAFAAPGATATQ
ncbi:MAG: zinc-dependent metalloprotease [Candidatus Eiseniibacteriota bacterium]